MDKKTKRNIIISNRDLQKNLIFWFTGKDYKQSAFQRVPHLKFNFLKSYAKKWKLFISVSNAIGNDNEVSGSPLSLNKLLICTV